MRQRITKSGAMLGAAVLLAGVSLASAQGMKEQPGGAGGSSPGISGGAPAASPGGAEPRKGGAPSRGESIKGGPSGGEKMDRGQAQRPSMQDRTTGQGSRESTKPEPKAAPASEPKAQPAPEPKAGKAAQDKAAKDKAAQDKAKSTTGQGTREGAKPAPEQKAQPQPSQQPQRQQTQTPSDTKSGTTGSGTATQSQPSQPSQPSGAATQSQSGVTIDAQKQASIQQSVLSARNAPRVSNVNFAISTGTVVPSHVRFVSISTFPILVETFPIYRDHVFFIVEDEIVILEPRTRRIVEVVPVGPRRVSRGGGTSVEVLQLTEPEIREVQLVLVQRGLLVQADVTGVLNERTRTALITFQRKEGLQASGSIDVRTVSALGLTSKVGPQKTGATGSSPTTGQAPGGQQPQQPSAQQGQTGQQPQAQPGGQQSQQGTQGQPSPQGQAPSTTGSAPSTTGQGSQPGQGSAQQPAQNPQQDQNPPSRNPQSNPGGTAPAR